jgi:hypothetical protein
MGRIDESLIGKTRSDKLVIFWVSYLDHQQRVLLFTQDERVAKGARKVMYRYFYCCCQFLLYLMLML